jgi:hypothetical protein
MALDRIDNVSDKKMCRCVPLEARAAEIRVAVGAKVSGRCSIIMIALGHGSAAQNGVLHQANIGEQRAVESGQKWATNNQCKFLL